MVRKHDAKNKISPAATAYRRGHTGIHMESWDHAWCLQIRTGIVHDPSLARERHLLSSRPVTCRRVSIGDSPTEWSGACAPTLLSFTNAARLLFLFQLFPVDRHATTLFWHKPGSSLSCRSSGELMTLMLRRPTSFHSQSSLKLLPPMNHCFLRALLSHHFCKIEKTPFPVDRFEPAAPALRRF